MAVYVACYISTLLYGSETWTTYAGQESRFNTFHLRSIRRILGISWLYKVTNADVLSHAGLPSMHTLLRQRRRRWLGHVRRMDDGRTPKYILYGELALGRRTTGHPHLRYKDICVKDMKAVDIDTMSWEGLAADRTKWRSALKTGKDKLMTDAVDMRAGTKEDSSSMTCLVYMSWCKYVWIHNAHVLPTWLINDTTNQSLYRGVDAHLQLDALSSL